MKAIRVLLGLLLLLAAGSVGAQLYKWIDKDGKVRYGDTPPPGVKSTSIKAPAPGAAPPASAKADPKGAKSGPLTPAEQEQAFRKRQADAEKAAEKAEADNKAKAERAENCARARENLRTLQSGQRIARTNASGERYFLDEAQIAQEASQAQAAVQKVCE